MGKRTRARIEVPLAVRCSCTEPGIGRGISLTDPKKRCGGERWPVQPDVRLAILSEDGTEEPGAIGEVRLDSPQ